MPELLETFGKRWNYGFVMSSENYKPAVGAFGALNQSRRLFVCQLVVAMSCAGLCAWTLDVCVCLQAFTLRLCSELSDLRDYRLPNTTRQRSFIYQPITELHIQLLKTCGHTHSSTSTCILTYNHLHTDTPYAWKKI